MTSTCRETGGEIAVHIVEATSSASSQAWRQATRRSPPALVARCRAPPRLRSPTGKTKRAPALTGTLQKALRNAKAPSHKDQGPPQKAVRQRPTLPHPPRCSTIGAGRLNYRVRNVTGCFPSAITTETTPKEQQPTPQPVAARKPHSEHKRLAHPHQMRRRLHRVRSSPRSISTGQLHPSQSFHHRPINPLISRGPYPLLAQGWETSSRGRLPA